jgi:hypothetical protein
MSGNQKARNSVVTVLRHCYLVERTTGNKMRAPHKCSVRGGFAAVSCVVALAACGSSRGPSSTTGSRTYSQAVEFADCMRAHGVPGFPDPSGAGGSINLPNTGTPVFKSASRVCARLAPGARGGVRATESQFLAAMRFAECMRTHGDPGIPDPTRGSGPTPFAALSLGHDLYFQASPTFNPNAPAVLRAATACGIARWAGGP